MEIEEVEKKMLKSLKRSDLENIALQVSRLNYFKLRTLLGDEICTIKTTADSILLKKVYSNLQRVHKHCSVALLLIELEERGYYSRIINMTSITIAEL